MSPLFDAVQGQLAKPVPAREDLEPEERTAAHVEIQKVFTPAAPVNNRDLFAGRIHQLSDLLSITNQIGTHGVIYGERGVGKTSLAAVVVNLILSGGGIAARANCDSGDSFTTVWQKVLDDVTIIESRARAGFTRDLQQTVKSARGLLPERAGPGDVLVVLRQLAGDKGPVIFLDEFDRIGDPRTRAMFADTIKMLSDRAFPATIVLVGVADTVDELVSEHASVERALVQIQMPRMSRPELQEIVKRGVGAVQMRIDEPALHRVTRLSQGLPHYTHLLAQQAAMGAIGDGVRTVRGAHVDTAVGRAMDRAQRSIVNAYHQATVSPQRSTIYPQVLLATALAQADELGSFAPADVRAPLSAIMGKPYEIPAFVRHLHALSEPERGEVLQKRGIKHRYRFRFRNPLLQPYVVMHGLNDGSLTQAVLEDFS
jgi:Cdc6-like AAA superfamily ATPase